MANDLSTRLVEQAKARAMGGEGLERFLLDAIAAIDPDDLAKQEPTFLIEALVRSHDRLVGGSTDDTRIIATPPATSGDPLIIDIISPDMPFIVDSALAALRTMGGNIRLFAHPVVRLSQGAVTGNGGTAMSLLHIHSDPVAGIEALLSELEATLRDVARAVRDWQPMLERVRRGIAGLATSRSPLRDEAINFLEWLTEHNFTFLGSREYRLEGETL